MSSQTWGRKESRLAVLARFGAHLNEFNEVVLDDGTVLHNPRRPDEPAGTNTDTTGTEGLAATTPSDRVAAPAEGEAQAEDRNAGVETTIRREPDGRFVILVNGEVHRRKDNGEVAYFTTRESARKSASRERRRLGLINKQR